MNTKHVSIRAACALGCLLALAGCASQRVSSVPVSSFAPRGSGGPSSSVASAPVPVHFVAPEYPRAMRADGIEGSVNVACRIDASGQLRRAEVVSSTHEEFESPALAAVRQWTFKPAVRDGVPVEMEVTIPVRFVFVDDSRSPARQR